MILLLDANLSWRLIQPLKIYFEEVWHIESIKLPQPAKDFQIWDFARSNNAIIVTNDDDFYKLSILKGFPPKVIILRTGNQSNNYLVQILIKHIQDIRDLHKTTDYGLLEII